MRACVCLLNEMTTIHRIPLLEKRDEQRGYEKSISSVYLTLFLNDRDRKKERKGKSCKKRRDRTEDRVNVCLHCRMKQKQTIWNGHNQIFWAFFSSCSLEISKTWYFHCEKLASLSLWTEKCHSIFVLFLSFACLLVRFFFG